MPEIFESIVYLAVFTVLFILNSMAMKQKRPGLRTFLVCVSFVVLLVFIGFRYNVGTDYGSYLKEYQKVATTSWPQLPSLRLELFVAALFKVCSYVFADPKLIFIVLGFLLLYPIYKVNKIYNYKYLAYSVLTFCILFLPFGLNGMRQGIAMGFTLLACVRFIRNDVKIGIIDFIVSVLFHTSAWIVLPYIITIYICKRWNISFTKVNILLTAIIAIAVLFFLGNMLAGYGFTQYDYMLGNTSAEKISLRSVISYIPIAVLVFSLRGEQNEHFETTVMKNLTISGICLFAVGTSAQYLSRFGLYFIMPSIILLPELIQGIRIKQTRLVLKGLFVVYLIVFFVTQYAVRGYHEILPYRTWVFDSEQISLVEKETSTNQTWLQRRLI